MNTEKRQRFDTLATDIEFLLISVIQGLAIQMLAAASTNPLSTFQFEYWPYIISAFTLILLFWTQAILHAFSFIKWPIDIVHTFLYFLASFVEVLTFNQVANPFKWFVGGIFFMVTIVLLYVYDLSMIKKSEKNYQKTKVGKELYQHLYTEQVKEMKLFVPSALVFNVICATLIFVNPELFIDQKYHIILSSLQAIFSVGLLVSVVRMFKKRSELLVA